MGDNRFNHHPRNNHLAPIEMPANNRIDLLLRSESPRVQQILLHQKLKEDIEKNSTGRVRYIDSELHLRNSNRTRSPVAGQSEIQIATLNIGLPSSSRVGQLLQQQQQQSASKIPITTLASSSSSSATNLNTKKSSGHSNELDDINNCDLNFDRIDGNSIKIHNNDNKSSSRRQQTTRDATSNINSNCQVCLIKEVRQDLMNINRIVQERNEQITKLKAKCLRSYFERQMLD